MIQILEDMLRSCIIEFGRCWKNTCYWLSSLINNSYQSNIKMTLYEAFYGRKCRTPVCWTKLGENKLVGLKLIRETEEKSEILREKKFYVDLKRKDTEYSVGKLSPRFIGAYEVLERIRPKSQCLSCINVEKIQPDLTYEEEPDKILSREVKELRNK
ncbi:Transposon Tf2-9 polyprotein [Gossypium australe]|uniref:Transposon Tf2-9 polyprotein n=1 Tax=Gossypium australe TaxID=47621 RepID=A0A5B6WH76_9ROSI|nr:Transposon Tf2-9 polyprotein [Gossypium australe]